MKIHNNQYLKNLGSTPAEIQAMLQSEKNRKKIQTESEATEKIREFQEQVQGAKEKKDPAGSRKNDGGSSAFPGNENVKKESGSGVEGDKKEGPGENPPPRAHIDIRI